MTAAAAMQSARALGEAWRRVSRQHLALGAACGCGIGFSIAANDLEEDICGFVEALAQRERRDDVADIVERLPRGVGRVWKIADLLEALTHADAAPAAPFLLPRLAVSIASLDQAHGAGRFACVA